MEIKVTMPQLGESVYEGTVAKWLVKEGDRVEKDQSLLEVSTDKVDTEIPSPESGVVKRLLVKEGETTCIGCPLVVIETEGAGVETTAKEVVKEVEKPKVPVTPEKGVKRKQRKVRLTPVVQRLVEEYDLEIDSIKGTGIGGRITKADVMRHLEEMGLTQGREGEEEEAEALKQEPVTTEAEAGAVGVSSPQPPVTPFGAYIPKGYEPKEGDRVIPLTKLRKIIADHMVYSKHVSPHVTTVTEVDMDRVVRLREERKDEVKAKEGFSLTYLPFVIDATIRALKDFPVLNSSLVGENLVIKKAINMGVAVDTEEGLVVTVIKDADEKSITGLQKAINTLAEKARSKKLSIEDVTGGTFTVTNPGREGNLFGTPIINQPQVGILRMGEIKKRPVVVKSKEEDHIAIHPVMFLSLSYDHRVIDGLNANRFLHRIKEHFEEGEFCF